MTEIATDEFIVEQFRKWLHETRQEAAEVNGESKAAPQSQWLGLNRLVDEFTALRHEIKLQTRSSRGLEEQLSNSLTTLDDAAATFRSAATQGAATSSEAVDKSFALALAELDESLERYRQHLEKIEGRLSAPSSPELLSQVNELWSGQSWWKRTLCLAFHSRVCRQITQAEERASSERKALLAALRSGYALIQQRLSRTLADVGIARIATIGQLVDPERMVVLEVVDGEGQPGTVLDEVRRGYTWQGRLLRTAEVRAIQPKFETTDNNA